MKRVIVGLLAAVCAGPAMAQVPASQTDPKTIFPAFTASLAAACGARPVAWADTFVQDAAARIQEEAPQEGVGWFKYPEPIFDHRSTGEARMAANAGARLFARYGKAACEKLADAGSLIIMDSAIHYRTLPEVRLLPANGVDDHATQRLLDVAFMAEAVALAKSCAARPAKWITDAADVITLEITKETSKLTDKPDSAGLASQTGKGATIMAEHIAATEMSGMRAAACAWVKTPSSLAEIDGLIADWRAAMARVKSGDLRGLGGK